MNGFVSKAKLPRCLGSNDLSQNLLCNIFLQQGVTQ